MKRLICWIMVCSMMLSAGGLASCASGTETGGTTSGDTTTETTTAAETLPPLEQLEKKDFEGRTFTIYEANWHPHLHINNPGDEMNGEIVNDALFERDAWIESNYNVNIEYVQEKSSTSLLKNTVLADDSEYDLAISEIYQGLAPLATQGILYNLCDIDDLALDENWWSPLMYEHLTLNGNLYFTTGDIVPAVYQAPMCMFLNLKLYEDYNIQTDIWELVLNGGWTMDAVQTLTKDFEQDLNNDSKLHANDDLFGIVMQHTTESSDAFFTAANQKLATASKDGSKLEAVSLSSGSLADALEKIIDTVFYVEYEGINDVINKTFKEDRSLLLMHKLESAAVNLRDMESDYLILPMPKLDENQSSYISLVSGYVCSFVAVPATADAQFTGLVAEAMARYSNQYVRPKAYDLVYKVKDTRDDRSAEVLDILFDTLYLDFNIVYDFGKSRDELCKIVFEDAPIASTLAALESSFKADMNTLIESWK
ncbi:MAG: hypothetical protein IJ493_13400 [Clostridia bacterium]|nr:hypothetical protein [Clostridia bacterium]